MQEDKEPLFDTVKTLRQTLAIYIPLLSTLTIHPDVMRQAAENGHLNATALAEYLVKCGMSFRAAHETTGKMVAFCVNKKCRLEDLSLQEMQKFSAYFTTKIHDILSIDNAVAACNRSNQSSLSIHEQEVRATQTWVAEKKSLLGAVYDRFDLS